MRYLKLFKSFIIRRVASPWLLLSPLAACVSAPQNEGAPATVADVVSRIKLDLGIYQTYDAMTGKFPPLDNICQASVGFQIDSVKVSLTTQTDTTVSGSASATLPVGGFTLGPSGSLSRESKGSQVLTFMLYPKFDKQAVQSRPDRNTPVPPIDAEYYPIAASLQRLRDGLLQASYGQPCVALAPPNDNSGKVNDPGGTFVFGFTVINQGKTGFDLKFLIFALGASGTTQTQAGNTLTVNFRAKPGSAAA